MVVYKNDMQPLSIKGPLGTQWRGQEGQPYRHSVHCPGRGFIWYWTKYYILTLMLLSLLMLPPMRLYIEDLITVQVDGGE